MTMKRLSNDLRAWAAAVMLGWFSASAFGQVPLAHVASYLPAYPASDSFDLASSTPDTYKTYERSSTLTELDRNRLVKRRETLATQRQRLNALIEQHNKKTAPVGAPEAEKLRLENVQLRELMTKHVAASRAFNDDVARAEVEFRTHPVDAAAWQKFKDDFQRNLNTRANQGHAISAPIINSENDRSAYNYARVIGQFNVTNSVRYAPIYETNADGTLSN